MCVMFLFIIVFYEVFMVNIYEKVFFLCMMKKLKIKGLDCIDGVIVLEKG